MYSGFNFNTSYIKPIRKAGKYVGSKLSEGSKQLYKLQQKHGRQALAGIAIAGDLAAAYNTPWPHDRQRFLTQAFYRAARFPRTGYYRDPYVSYRRRPRYRFQRIQPSRRYRYRQYYRKKRLPYWIWLRNKRKRRRDTRKSYKRFTR